MNAPQWPFPTNLPPKKKLTFDEWWAKNSKGLPIWWQENPIPAKEIWNAAQENK